MSLAGTPSLGSATDGGLRRSTAQTLADGVVVFEVAGQLCGLPVEVTREVVNLDRLVHVPRAKRGILGLFPLRGAPLCAVDAAAVLDDQASPATRRLGLVIARGRTATCALAIDLVVGVVRIAADAMIPRDETRESPIVLGFCTVSDRTVTLLDPGELLRRIEDLRFH